MRPTPIYGEMGIILNAQASSQTAKKHAVSYQARKLACGKIEIPKTRRGFMVRRILASILAPMAFAFCAMPLVQAQATGERINFYFSDWHNAAPRTIHGSLEERYIYTPGDPHNPTQKGAVLRFISGYSHATLAPHASTQATRLDGQQEIYFVASGHGTASAGGQTADLFRNIAVLMPANLEFTIKNSGDEPLEMYLIHEPTPSGFRPNSSMLVRDGNKIPIASTEGHWAHIDKPLFVTDDGLGTLESVYLVALDPLTMGRPHVVDHDDIEEVWTALDGTSLAFVSNELRRQTPGMSFYHIPDNKTPHTNINQNEDAQVSFLYFARYHPHDTRK
jgi:mannose-6-phosphate isomerase-like protein (cupin superfamily)